MLTIEVTCVFVASFPCPTQKETNISYLLATPSHYELYVRSSRMSELSRFVYMKSHVTLHVKASAQKVNLSRENAGVLRNTVKFSCLLNAMSSRLEKRQHNTAQPGHKSLRNKNVNRRKTFSLLQCKKQRSTKFLQNRKACMYQENKKIILYLYNLDIFPLRIVLRGRSKDRHLYICLCLRNPPSTHPSETTNQI